MIYVLSLFFDMLKISYLLDFLIVFALIFSTRAFCGQIWKERSHYFVRHDDFISISVRNMSIFFSFICYLKTVKFY